jgi:hypothetical protein
VGAENKEIGAVAMGVVFGVVQQVISENGRPNSVKLLCGPCVLLCVLCVKYFSQRAQNQISFCQIYLPPNLLDNPFIA